LQNKKGYDFEMIYFNSDGNESTMCGNGGRCAVSFAHLLQLIDTKTSFVAVDGIHEAFIDEKAWVHLSMSDVNQIEKRGEDYVLNTGSPHFVKPVENVDDFDIVETGRSIRYNDEFRKEGINVNLMQVIEKDIIMVETYERGVEDETLSCGTGVTACALVQMKNSGCEEITVKTKGGLLKVSSQMGKENFSKIVLSGPTTKVYKGKYIINQ